MKKKLLKILLMLLEILFILFILINLAWLIGVKLPYDRYGKILKEEAIGYDDMGFRYYNDDFSFKVADIKYLDFINEIRVVVSGVEAYTVSYEQNEEGTYVPIEQNDPMITIRMYRNFFGTKRYTVDYWDMVNHVDFMCAVDADLNILRIGEVDYGGDEMIELMRKTIAENYDKMKAMYDFTYDLVGEV